MHELPEWLKMLDDEDIQFIKRFVLASGSLKTLAEEYGISYPTLRSRLDKLIEKVSTTEDSKLHDPFQKRLQLLLIDNVIDTGTAKKLMRAYKDSMHQNQKEETV